MSLAGDVELVRTKLQANEYLQNVSKVQYSFTSSLKRYDFKEDMEMKTIFHVNEPPRSTTAFLRPNINSSLDNPWEDLEQKSVYKESRILPTVREPRTLNQS